MIASLEQSQFVDLILRRLESERDVISDRFTQAQPIGCTRHVAIDDLLPEGLAVQVHACFPAPAVMRRMASFRERKYTFKGLDDVPALLRAITFAFQDPRVVACVEAITGIRGQRPDASLYAGGISLMASGDFLNPHIDNSHDGLRRHYRTLNLLYYVTPQWREEYGGNLELWDATVRHKLTVASRFNRLVLMATTPRSWHSVSRVRHAQSRCCVSNYYFSEQSPEGAPYFNVTSFSAPPDRPIVRLVSRVDAALRNALRCVVKQGLGRSDVYTPRL